MTTTNNPFTPPRAAVSDYAAADDNAVQEPRVFSTKGRIGRLRYFGWSSVASMLLFVIIGIAAAAVFGTGASPAIFFGVYALSVIPAMVFAVMVLIQRSHDMGWSGWTALIALFVPLAVLVWMFKPGTPGTNRYGPKPTPNPTGVKIAAFTFPVLIIGAGILAAAFMPSVVPPVAHAGGNPYGELAEPAPAAATEGGEPVGERPAEQAAEQPAQQPAPSGTSTQ